MKIFTFVFIISTVLVSLGFAQNTAAQESKTPPLLMQQTQLSSVQSSSTPGLMAGTSLPPSGPGMMMPGSPEGPAGPPTPGPGGIPVVQRIPAQTLLANLQQAVVTVEKLNKLFTPGNVWIMRGPTGEIEIKGGLLYQGAVVAVLHFNPINGTILALGINPHVFQNNIGMQSIKSNLITTIGNLKILPVAEFMEPQNCWSFPLVMGSTIVASIKVYYDGIHILPDYMANQEMISYGQ